MEKHCCWINVLLIFCCGLSSLAIIVSQCHATTDTVGDKIITKSRIEEIIKFADEQYDKVCEDLELGVDYIEIAALNETRWETFTAKEWKWTMGFFPGILWQLYKHTGDEKWLKRARIATDGCKGQEFNDENHDVGFVVMSSFGEQYHSTGNQSLIPIIVQAADSLASRYNEKMGCIRSWGPKDDTKQFLVIVDNMMNLNLLFEAYKFTKNETYVKMAISHADLTIREHIRKDYSSWHIVNFDQNTGKAIEKYTGQGYANNSCWTRGEAWMILGFMQTYQSTRLERFLRIAEHLADYFIEHLPDEKVPNMIAPWDFSLHPSARHPYIPKDISANLVATIGLFELYKETNKTRYLQTAKYMVESMLTGDYLLMNRPKGSVQLPAIMGNSTIGKPGKVIPLRVDDALCFSEYYFLQLLDYIRFYLIG